MPCSWVICDTGSTDGTQDLLTSYFAAAGIPGHLANHTWKDFGHNRNLCLEVRSSEVWGVESVVAGHDWQPCKKQGYQTY